MIPNRQSVQPWWQKRHSTPILKHISTQLPQLMKKSLVSFIFFLIKIFFHHSIERQMAAWTSPVYQNFKMPPAIVIKKGVVAYVYTCIAYILVYDMRFILTFAFTSHPSITVSRAQHDESTSNLKRHVTNCEPAQSSQMHALTAYASGSKYTQASHWMKIVLWITNRHRPFLIVEDTELLDIFHDLNPCCITPKQKSASRDVKEIFRISCIEVGVLLRVSHPLLYIFS